MNGSERKEEYEDGFQERTGVPCEDAGLMMWRQECRDSLFSGDGLHCFGFLGFLVTKPGAAGHFHAAFFVDSEALGGDDVAFFDDVLDVLSAAFGEFEDVDESVLVRAALPRRCSTDF